MGRWQCGLFAEASLIPSDSMGFNPVETHGLRAGTNRPLPYTSKASTHRVNVYAKRQLFDTLADDLHTNYAIGEAANRAARYALKRANSVGLRSSLRPGETVRWSVTSDSDRPYWRMIGIK